MTKLVIGCNYHTTWQSHKAMRFVLEDFDTGSNKATLSTRSGSKKIPAKIDDLIFIDSMHNRSKAKRLEANSK